MLVVLRHRIILSINILTMYDLIYPKIDFMKCIYISNFCIR